MRQLFIRILTSFFLILIIFYSLKSITVLNLFLIIVSYFALVEFYNLFNRIFNKKYFHNFLAFIILLIYIAMFSAYIWIYLIPFNLTSNISFIFLLLICTSTDIGGFVFGKLIGGKKLTKISPNKTYSGVVGSFIFPLILGYFFYNYFSDLLKFEINILIIIFVISLISQFGDLIISFLKRKAKIKDTGNILPGHGGILDRIDGILLALPIGFVLISF